MTIFTRFTLASAILATSLVAVAFPAGANPCTNDRSFAEANDCSDVYDANRLTVSGGPTVPNGRVR